MQHADNYVVILDTLKDFVMRPMKYVVFVETIICQVWRPSRVSPVQA